MHDTALAAGAAFFSTYFPGATPRVLDIGSLDVNGSMRSAAPPGADYVGVDLEAGPGVDVVLQPGQPLPFPPGSFDACVSVACFEHDTAFWDTFLQMVRAVRPGGYIYILVPSNGPYHAYPADNWRFYADAGLALVAWAGRQGQQVELIESGTLRRRADVWNDFVGVFQKHPVDAAPRERFMLDAFPDAMNIRRLGQAELLACQPTTEDVALLEQARAELETQRSAHEAELNQARAEVKGWAETAENWRAEAQRLLAVQETQRNAHAAELTQARAESKVWNETAENWRAEAHRLLAAKDAERAAHEAERVQLAQHAQDLDAQRSILSAEIEELRRQLLARGAELGELERRMQAVLSSTSWRITRPLRSAVHLLRPHSH